MNHSKLSIIIPIYNTHRYLVECIESVQRQTFQDFEMICIDDGSEDSSWELLREYAEADERIRIFQNDRNRGLSYTRNRGIEMAKGEYIFFLDSDDYLAGDALELLTKQADEQRLDMLLFDFKFRFEEGVRPWARGEWKRLPQIDEVLNGRELFAMLSGEKRMEPQACFKLYRREFLTDNGLFFMQELLHEDFLFTFQCMMQAERTSCCARELYVYRKHTSSITNAQSEEHINLRIQSLFHIRLLIADMWKDMEVSQKLDMAIANYLDDLRNRYLLICDRYTGALRLTWGNAREDYLFALFQRDHERKSRYAQISANILNIIKGYKSVVLYGAGLYGRQIYDRLEQEGINISAFLVTDSDTSGKLCRGKEVLSLEKYHNRKDEIIVLSVSAKYYDDIISRLQRRGIDNYLLLQEEGMYDIWMQHPVQNNKIFFDAFHGLGYMCNPKYIAEELRRRNADVDMVWDVTDDANMEFPSEIRTVHRGELEFYREYYTSHIVVTNMNSIGGVKKRPGQYFINTWHGTGPFKKVGRYVYEISGNQEAYQNMIKEYENVDMAIAACEQCVHNHRVAFEYKGDIEKWGYPRNDIFFKDMKLVREKVYHKLGIDREKKIILYAPTFRYSIKSGEKSIHEVYDINLDAIKQICEERFGQKYVMLYRLHQYIYRSQSIGELFEGHINVTMYPDMQELLAAADILITDWSSSIWDFSLLLKPVFLFFHDEDDADKENGFYVRPSELPYPQGGSTEELCDEIEKFDELVYERKVKEFVDCYQSYDKGHASESVADRIMDVIEYPEKYGT